MRQFLLFIVVLFSTVVHAQPRVSVFGASRPQDTSKTFARLVLPAYATTETENIAFTIDSTGQMILRSTAEFGRIYRPGYGVLIEDDTVSLDSALVNGIYLKIGDSVVTYITPTQLAAKLNKSDTASLSNRINSRVAYVDSNTVYTTKYGHDTLKTSVYNLLGTKLNKADTASLSNRINQTTWQQTAVQNRTLDSGLVSNNFYIGTLNNSRPTSLNVFGDSRSVPFGISAMFGWSQRLADFMGWRLINRSVSGTVLMKQTPVNPYGIAPNMVDDTARIKNVNGLTDSNYYIVVSKIYNDVAWTSANYTAANLSADYRIILNNIQYKGYDMASRVVIWTAPYVSPTAYTSQGGNPAATSARHIEFNDTVKALAAQYGCKVFDAYAWERDHYSTNLYQTDSVHENINGHGILFEGMLKTLTAPVVRNNQSLAVQGTMEVKRIKVNLSDTTDTAGIAAAFLGINRYGYGFVATNAAIINNSIFYPAQGANFHINGIGKAGTFVSSYGVFTGSTAPGPDVTNNNGQAIVATRNALDSRVCSTATASPIFLNPSAGTVAFRTGSTNAFGQENQFTGSLGISGGMSLRGTVTLTNTIGMEIYYNGSFGGVIDARNRATSTGLDLCFGSQSDNLLFNSLVDRGTGKYQFTSNISVLGTNSSNTIRWDNASASPPSNTLTPVGWLIININGSTAYLPYYQ